MTLFGISVLIMLVGLVLMAIHKFSKLPKVRINSIGREILYIGFIAALIVSLIGVIVWDDYNDKYAALTTDQSIFNSLINNGDLIGDQILIDKITEYNNTVRQIHINRKLLILKDYFDKGLDWNALELIELEQ